MKDYKLKINGREYNVSIKDIKDNAASVTVNGTPYEVELESAGTAPRRAVAKEAPASQPGQLEAKPATPSGSATPLKSPLPGTVFDIRVREGDAVKAGQAVMILEAMKMENNIEADRDGVIDQIKAAKGDSVLEGDVLLTIR